MRIPLGEDAYFIDKNKHVRLDEFIYNPDQNLVHAHRLAYEGLLEDVELKKFTGRDGEG